MDFDAITNKLISKTEDGSLKWEHIKYLPEYITLSAKDVTKIFTTYFDSQMQFYLIEYSFPVYSDAMDDYYNDYAIRCSIVNNNVETVNFNRTNLDNPYAFDKLMELVMEKCLKTSEKLDDFLNS